MTKDEKNFFQAVQKNIDQIGSNTSETFILGIQQSIDFAPKACQSDLQFLLDIRLRLINQAEAAIAAKKAGYKPIMSAKLAKQIYCQ